LGDETSYPPNQELETTQEPVLQDQSGDHPSDADLESQALQESEVVGVDEISHEETSSEETSTEDEVAEGGFSEDVPSEELLSEVQASKVDAPEVAGAPVDFAEPVDLQLDRESVPAVEIRSAEPAPLVASASKGAAGDSTRELLGLPLQFLNQLLQKLGSAKLDSLADLIPSARLVAIALLAGVALKLTGATLGAINDIPLLGGLLELIGLVSMLNFLARNALKHQKRAELLSRIRKLKQDFLG
jgi:hypothetical protein